MKNLYPMQFTPVYKDYVWGGRKLERFGRKLPESGIVAESWEISSHDDGMTRVREGFFKDQTIQEVMNVLGEELVGTKNQWALNRGKFPLLIKLLDAQQPLSVQVHPDDNYALQYEGNELGKTEMWVVLNAEPGAAIIYGLSRKTEPKTLRMAIESGDLEQYLNTISINTGDHICVPAGTLHAIMGGAVLAEIQQNSNTTYRVYDWNRTGADGKPRPLHINKALEVINYNQVGCSLPQPHHIKSKPNYHIEQLCKNTYFTTNRYTFTTNSNFEGVCDGTTLEIWGVLSGEVNIAGIDVNPVDFILLPAGLGNYTIKVKDSGILLHIFTT